VVDAGSCFRRKAAGRYKHESSEHLPKGDNYADKNPEKGERKSGEPLWTASEKPGRVLSLIEFNPSLVPSRLAKDKIFAGLGGR
jgi:hypothetical protein